MLFYTCPGYRTAILLFIFLSIAAATPTSIPLGIELIPIDGKGNQSSFPIRNDLSSAHSHRNLPRSDWKPWYELHITAEEIMLGCDTRFSVVVNGQSPGPTLFFQEGVTTWVRVYNHIAESKDVKVTGIMIHWHGLDIDPWMDGTPLTQYPIKPGCFFDYKITPRIGSAGSYLYHDHTMSFATSTLTGALIVSEAKGARQYNVINDIVSDDIIFISENFPTTDREVEERLAGNPFHYNDASTVLLNGRAWYNGVLLSSTCTVQRYKLIQGAWHRFRFISGTALNYLYFALQGHELYIIEADGHYTQQLPVKGLHINSGQRYSVLIRGKTDAQLAADGRKSYWLHGAITYRDDVLYAFALFYYDGITHPAQFIDGPAEAENYATEEQDYEEYEPVKEDDVDIEMYYDFYRSKATGIIFPRAVLKDFKLKPLQGYGSTFPQLSEVTKRVYIDALDVEFDSNGVIRPEPDPIIAATSVEWHLNGRPWFHPTDGPLGIVPTLIAAAGRLVEYQFYYPLPSTYTKDIYDAAYDLYAVELGDIVEVVFRNIAAEFSGYASDAHPFHMHGQHYFDTGAGPGDYNAEMNQQNMDNGDHYPLLRDTSVLYKFYGEGQADGRRGSPDGWRAWRWRVTSAGTPLLHCHGEFC